MHGHGVQTPRISIKYSITVKAERDREERPDKWKWKKSQIYIYIYRYESIKATILQLRNEKKIRGSVADLGSVIWRNSTGTD